MCIGVVSTASCMNNINTPFPASMNFLDRRVAAAGIPSSRNDDWQPLIGYRNSLLHGESDHAAGAAVVAAVPTVTPKRAYTRKRNKDYNEDDEENDDSDADPDFRG